MALSKNNVEKWFDEYLKNHTITSDDGVLNKDSGTIIKKLDDIKFDGETTWTELVNAVIAVVGVKDVSFEKEELPPEKSENTIANSTTDRILQEIEGMDIGFQAYLTKYLTERLSFYLEKIFNHIKDNDCVRGKGKNYNLSKKGLKYFIAIWSLTGFLSEELIAWIIIEHADIVGGPAENLKNQLNKSGVINKATRETIFRIMFALHISLKDARDWLCCGMAGEYFDPRNIKEGIYCYALANGYGYNLKSGDVSVESMLKTAEYEILDTIFQSDADNIRSLMIIDEQNDSDRKKYLKKNLQERILKTNDVAVLIIGCALLLYVPMEQIEDIIKVGLSDNSEDSDESVNDSYSEDLGDNNSKKTSPYESFATYCRYLYNIYTDRDNIRIRHRYDGFNNDVVRDATSAWIENIPFETVEEVETGEIILRDILSEFNHDADDFINYYVSNDYLYEKQDISLSRSEHFRQLLEDVFEKVNEYLEKCVRDGTEIVSKEELSVFLEGVSCPRDFIDRGTISQNRFFGDYLTKLSRIADVTYVRSDFVRLYFLKNACKKMMNPRFKSICFAQDLDNALIPLRYSGYNINSPLDVFLQKCLDTDCPIETYQTILNCMK